MRSNKGFTLTELLCSLTILSILLSIALPTFMRIIGNVRVSMAVNQLTLNGGKSRYDTIGEGGSPNTLCARNADDKIEFQTIYGTDCDSLTSWQTIGGGVAIDTTNSTLRSVRGVAGHGSGSDRIYRLSFADTAAGLGASYGQLGKLVISHPWTPKRKCFVLSHIDGKNDIREGKACLR